MTLFDFYKLLCIVLNNISKKVEVLFMVSTLSLFFMVLTLVISIGVPVVLLIYFHRKYKISALMVILGVAGMTVMQFFIRIPVLQGVLPQMDWFLKLTKNTWLYALFLGGTAGIFEETGRFIVFGLTRKKRQWKDGIAYGIGHGGIESILLIGLTYINNLAISIMINSGAYDTMVAPSLPAGQAEQIKNLLIGTSPGLYAMAGFERLFTVFVQIALSIVVLTGFIKGKRLLYLLLAILLHTLVDAPLVILAAKGVSPYVIEMIILVMAVIAVFYIVKTRNAFTKENADHGVSF